MCFHLAAGGCHRVFPLKFMRFEKDALDGDDDDDDDDLGDLVP